MSAIAATQRTVLVVEDSADDLHLLQLALQRFLCPFQFRYVHDGEAAIAYLEGREPYSDRRANPFPDLALLDISLPKVDGFELLEWIRKTPGCESLKVVVWTGWDYPAYEKRAAELGALQTFLKPSEVSGLKELLAGIARVVGTA